MEATELFGWDVGCHIGCDLRTEVTPRRIPVFIGVSDSLGCDVGRYWFLIINQIWNGLGTCLYLVKEQQCLACDYRRLNQDGQLLANFLRRIAALEQIMYI